LAGNGVDTVFDEEKDSILKPNINLLQGVAKTACCVIVNKRNRGFRNPQSYQENQKGPEKDLGGENDKRSKSKSSLDKAGFEKKEARKE